MSAVGFAVMGFAAGFVAIVLIYAATSIANTPVLPLGDSYVMRGLAVRNLGYGPVRLWGSVAFILANMAGGVFLSALGGHDVIWVIAAAMAATAVATAAVAPKPRGRTTPSRKAGRGWLAFGLVRDRGARRKPYSGEPRRALRLCDFAVP